MIKLSKSASMIRKRKEQPATVTRQPGPVPKPARTTRSHKITGRKPTPVICERVNKCIWFQAPGILEDDYGAICTLATMHYEVKHKRKARVTDHIISMSECPLPKFEAGYPGWKDYDPGEVDMVKLPPVPLIQHPYMPVKYWNGVKIPWR